MKQQANTLRKELIPDTCMVTTLYRTFSTLNVFVHLVVTDV